MKKRIAFYIVWDVIFYFFVYLVCNIENTLHDGYFRMELEHMSLVFIVPVFLWIAAGTLICWLVLVTVKQEVNVKSAAVEFVIVGGLGLYLAMSLIFYIFIPSVTGLNLQLSPRWLPFDRNLITITLGGILFGYEILMFIVRIVSCRKKVKLSEPNNL